MFALVEIAAKQYKVEKGDIIEVSRIAGEIDASLEFDKVMLIADDKETLVGTPYLANKKVKAKILAQIRGEKIAVRRYKSKVRYRRARGFRAELTKLEIVSIG